jgi:amino acid adenylation domain-containing protein
MSIEIQEGTLEGYRLSPQQRHLWTLLRHGRNDPYQAKCAVSIKGCFEKSHLKAAAQNVITRHEILRTTFRCLPGMTIPMQVIEETVGISWQEDNMSGLDDRDSLIETIFHETSHPFDIEQGPLLHLHVIERSKKDYVLILRLPAICADSMSLRNLVGELSRGYAAVVCGDTVNGEVAQYADLAEWQNELIESEETRAGREYWRKLILQRQPMPQLAFEGGPAIDAAFEPRLDEVVIAPLLTAGIESFARSRETSPGHVLLACWQILLWRYTGLSEVEVGAAFDGRRAEEIEDALGLFAKYLPVTSHLEEGLQCRELLEDLDRSLQTAQEWQEYFSWEQIAGSPANAPGASYFPFCFEPEPEFASFLAGGISFTIIKQYVCIDCFKIKLSYARRADRLVIEFHYNSKLFRPDDIRFLIGRFHALLENVVTNPFTKLGDLEMLTGAERRQFLVEYNSTKIEWPQEKFAHELISDQARRSPEAVAVIYEGEQVTYYELNDRAVRLANCLRGLGIGPETVIGLCMDRSTDLVVSLLAILKAGAAYLPLDPSYPQARLSFMLEDAGARALLTQAHLRSRLPQSGDMHVMDVSAQWAFISQTAALECETMLSPDNLAYVIYTSGSTGKPKGVMLRHGSLANYLLWAIDYYPLKAGFGAPVHSPLSFDLTVTSLFAPLLAGGCVHLLSTENEIEALVSALSGSPGYSLVKLTPAHLQLLAELLKDVDLAGAAHSLVVGGENLPAQTVERWKERAAQTRFFNEYGPTESVVGCCVYEAGSHPEAEEGRSVIPIGRPIANTSLYLLDSQLRLSPKGAVSELCVGGEGLARGYLNRPELTAESFAPSPYSEETGARLYRTGDLARYLRDGQIECLGRMDDQVKIRGYRVELGEIEAHLTAHPAVREAVVVAREDDSGAKVLVAYYAPVEESGNKALVDAESLWRYLTSVLPEHMMPAAYVMLEALPLTSNGKLDRRALPAPGMNAYVAREYAAPVGEIENALARIWSDLLHVERVGRHDKFFALGGHSLLTVILIERMRGEGLHADVRAFFASPTLAALAATVSRESRLVEVPPNLIPPGCQVITPEMLPLARLSVTEIERIVSKTPGAAANVQDIYPLAPLQEGILFHYLLETEGDPYLGYGLYRFDSRRRLETFLQSLQFVIDRHDILRTAVQWEGLSEPMQVVWRHAPLIVEEIRFDSRAGDVSEQLRGRFDPRRYRIDISQAPMMRAYIAPEGLNGDGRERQWTMLLLFQHLSIDHVTMEILLEDIQAHLLGRADQLPAPLPFRNFVAQARLGVSREEHESFFREMLSDVDEPTTPYDLIDAQSDGSGIGESWLEVDHALADRMRRTSRALGVSAASLCHLACALVLGRVSGRDDVVFGTVLFGRMQSGEGSDRAPGVFINTLPIRIQIGAESVRDGVRRIYSLLTQLLRHEHAPLALTQRCSAVAAPTPLFSAYFNYRHNPTADVPADALGKKLQAWEGIESLGAEQTTNYPFSLSVDDWGGSYTLGAKAQSPIDTDRVCAYMSDALEQIVTVLEQAPATPMRNLDVLPASERRQLLVEWNGAEAGYPRGRCVHELFAERAERSPEQIALTCDGHWMSFGELNRRANQIGNYLQRLGVGPEVVVGVCLDRSVEMAPALLGSLKAGGAYLPLDPDSPAERLGYVLEVAGVRVTLTQRRLEDRLQAFMGRTVCLDEEWARIDEESEKELESGVEPENLAYVIYTSGSTGRPKGVMVRHRGLVNYSYDICRRLGLEEGEAGRGLRFAMVSTIAADLGNTCIYPSLLSGGCLHILSYEVATDGARYEEYLKREPIDALKITPSHLNALLGTQGNGTRMLPYRFLILGGEALSRELVERIKERGEGCEVINHYGPTETTIGSLTAKAPEMDEEWRSATAPIGRPIANTASYILNRELNPAPVGVRGELHISGEGVARGYLKAPDLTAERFTPNPFSRESGERVYRTGDECRYLSDGKVEFLGRADDQVKIRGYRIELGEIQAVLNERRGVRQSVVVVRDDERGDKRLIAYVVGEEDATPAELKRHVRERLPAYMTPEDILTLKEIPVTANGKIDRKKLPAVESASRQLGREYVGPRTPVEKILVEIFEEVLNRDRVGIHDDFFEIGGHSLLATRVISRVRSTFDVETGIRDIFGATTVAKLAEILIAQEPKPGQTEKIAMILKRLDSMTDEEMIAELSAVESDLPRDGELTEAIQ